MCNYIHKNNPPPQFDVIVFGEMVAAKYSFSQMFNYSLNAVYKSGSSTGKKMKLITSAFAKINKLNEKEVQSQWVILT